MAASRGQSAVKFTFWTILAAGFLLYVAHLHTSGKFAEWYYYRASEDGYAVNADTFFHATKESPALLQIGDFKTISGLEAVPVKKGDRLPLNSNGVISTEQLENGSRASLDGNYIKVTVPWKIMESKGFKYKDTFKHKGVMTFPWAAVVNVALVISMGVSLGFMAEGFTDLIGIKLEKIQHFEGH